MRLSNQVTKLANYLKNKRFHVETQTNRGFHNSSTTSPTSTFSSFLLPPWWWDRARGGLTRFNVCSRALRRCCALESWPLESPPPPPRFSHKSAVSPDVCCPSLSPPRRGPPTEQIERETAKRRRRGAVYFIAGLINGGSFICSREPASARSLPTCLLTTN